MVILIILAFCSMSALSTVTSSKRILPVYINDFEKITWSYTFNKPVLNSSVIHGKTYDSYSIESIIDKEIIGTLTIPVKKMSLLLPPNTAFKKIHINNIVEPIDQLAPSQNDQKDKSKFPSDNVEVISTYSFRGFSLLMLKINPIYYDESECKLLFSQDVSFTIETEPINSKLTLYRHNTNDDLLVSEMIENPSMIPYYSQDTTSNNNDENDFKYIIITNSELEPFFNPLITYKSTYLSAKSVNLTFIVNNFNGIDLQEKIRNFIIYAYSNWNTEYVLLGGDVDVIPQRGLFGHAIDHEGSVIHDSNIPADIYYAGLDGTWDKDQDRIYGEDWGNSSGDEADFLAEVYVGRAPVSSKAEIGTFINKVISFETSEKPKKVQLHQSGINNRNEPDSTVIPESCAQWIPYDYTINKLYEVNQEITTEDWMNSFASNNLIIQHTGNGEIDQYFIDWPTTVFSNIQGLSVLSNDFYPIHTSVACHSGAFDYDDCIAESLLLNPYGGASACIFNSRWGFTSSDNAQKYSGEFIEQQFYQFFVAQSNNLGKIVQRSKEHFSMDAFKDPAYRWCYYTINLLGDPETPVMDKRAEQYSSSDIIVDDDFTEETPGWNVTAFNSIQKSIDAASNWDTILVKNGNYNERLIIKKTIKIVGENKQKTFLQSNHGQGKIVIKADRVRLEGFTIESDNLYLDLARIEVTNSNYVTISNCIIKNNIYAIWANEANNLFIVNNQFDNNLRGVYSNVKAGSIYIMGNTFKLNKVDSYGIYSLANARHIIQNNTFKSALNFYNFSCGIYIDGESQISSNIIDHCSVGIWVMNGVHSIAENVISNNKQIGLYAADSTTTISMNTIKENGNNWITYDLPFQPGGIIINGSHEQFCNVSHNKISNNHGFGILIKALSGSENIISYNDFISNSRDARFLNGYCHWHHNYWNNKGIFPKIILGGYETNTFFTIPLIQLDRYPSSLLINGF